MFEKFDNLPLITRILVFAAPLIFLHPWFAVVPQAGAAEITIPRLEMASRGWFEDDEFTISSRISLDLALTGGYKYSFHLGFAMEAPDIAKAMAIRNVNLAPLDPADDVLPEHYNALLEKQNNQAFIGFSVAKATINRIFNLPISLSYFVGSGDDYCSGDDFTSLFGVNPFGTYYRGFFYFPKGIGGNQIRQYNGIHGAKGTGLSLSFTGLDHLIIPIIYIYQDFALFPDLFTTGTSMEKFYSGDMRVLMNWNWLNLEAFWGLSWNSDRDVYTRMGLMFHLAGNGVEFFAQAGITSWKSGEKLNVDNMYFLIEPRLRFKYFGVDVTFFYHPVEYLNINEPEERGMADFNVKFMFGNQESGFTGGLETTVELNLGVSDDFMLRISPFGSFTSGGLLWEVKIRLNPTEIKNPKEMMDLFLGIRTAF